jgi:hypothetical protein
MAMIYKRISQLHFQGYRDLNIPPALDYQFAARQSHAHFKLYPESDHRCG